MIRIRHGGFNRNTFEPYLILSNRFRQIEITLYQAQLYYLRGKDLGSRPWFNKLHYNEV
jgi:hypothetical protein